MNDLLEAKEKREHELHLREEALKRRHGESGAKDILRREADEADRRVARDRQNDKLFNFADDRPVYGVISPEGKLELADGNQFRKQIVKFGRYVDPLNPGKKMSLNRAWAEQLLRNFKAKRAGRVAIPLTHTDAPQANTGELVDMQITDDGIDGVLDVRDPKTADAIRNDLIWDCSVSFDNNYVDKKTGQDVGPTLFHVALVNNPYLKGMQPFQALSEQNQLIMLSESKEQEMSTVHIKNDREFDVTVNFEVDGVTKDVVVGAGQEVEVPGDVEDSVKTQIAEATAPEVDKVEDEDKSDELDKDKKDDTKAEDEKKTDDEPVKDENKVDTDLAEENARLRRELAEERTGKAYENLLKVGRLVPAQKERFEQVMLAATESTTTVNLADGSTKSLSELITDLLNTGPKRIRFDEKGKTESEEPKTAWDALSPEARVQNEKLGVDRETFNKHNTAPITSDNDSSSDDDDEE